MEAFFSDVPESRLQSDALQAPKTLERLALQPLQSGVHDRRAQRGISESCLLDRSGAARERDGLGSPRPSRDLRHAFIQLCLGNEGPRLTLSALRSVQHPVSRNSAGVLPHRQWVYRIGMRFSRIGSPRSKVPRRTLTLFSAAHVYVVCAVSQRRDSGSESAFCMFSYPSRIGMGTMPKVLRRWKTKAA